MASMRCTYCRRMITGGKGDYWHKLEDGSQGAMRCDDGEHLAAPDLAYEVVERTWQHLNTRRDEAMEARVPWDPSSIVITVTEAEYRALAMDNEFIHTILNSSLGTDDERIFGARLRRDPGYYEVTATVQLRVPVSRFMGRESVERSFLGKMTGYGCTVNGINVRHVR